MQIGALLPLMAPLPHYRSAVPGIYSAGIVRPELMSTVVLTFQPLIKIVRFTFADNRCSVLLLLHQQRLELSSCMGRYFTIESFELFCPCLDENSCLIHDC